MLAQAAGTGASGTAAVSESDMSVPCAGVCVRCPVPVLRGAPMDPSTTDKDRGRKRERERERRNESEMVKEGGHAGGGWERKKKHVRGQQHMCTHRGRGAMVAVVIVCACVSVDGGWECRG